MGTTCRPGFRICRRCPPSLQHQQKQNKKLLVPSQRLSDSKQSDVILSCSLSGCADTLLETLLRQTPTSARPTFTNFRHKTSPFLGTPTRRGITNVNKLRGKNPRHNGPGGRRKAAMTPWQTNRLRSTRIQLYPEIEVLPPPKSRWNITAVNAASPLPNQQRLCRLSTLAPLERGAEPQTQPIQTVAGSSPFDFIFVLRIDRNVPTF